jgi:hypothetical protein
VLFQLREVALHGRATQVALPATVFAWSWSATGRRRRCSATCKPALAFGMRSWLAKSVHTIPKR